MLFNEPMSAKSIVGIPLNSPVTGEDPCPLTSALKTMINESISKKFILEMQDFTLVIAIITQIFLVKLLILVL
jgi:hypothetical protein